MNPALKNVLLFLGGCVAMLAVYHFAQPGKSAAKQDDAAVAIDQDPRVLQTQNQELRKQVAALIQQRDTCTSKFSRITFLYDVGLLGETRAWVIPADVEPVLASNKLGNYSHYDPKTQIETVHFKGKAAAQ